MPFFSKILHLNYKPQHDRDWTHECFASIAPIIAHRTTENWELLYYIILYVSPPFLFLQSFIWVAHISIFLLYELSIIKFIEQGCFQSPWDWKGFLPSAYIHSQTKKNYNDFTVKGMISQLLSVKKTRTFFFKQYSSKLNSQKIIVLLYNLLILTVLTYSAPYLKC